MTQREAPVEVMRELCEAAAGCWNQKSDREEPPAGLEPPERRMWKAMHAYRAAIAPKLRTRAEVDAELADAVRANVEHPSLALCQYIEKLAREETAPEPTTPELADPDPCSCDQALELQAKLDRIRALAEPAKGASSIPTRAERAIQQILEVLG
jgi:hypothetical protein